MKKITLLIPDDCGDTLRAFAKGSKHRGLVADIANCEEGTFKLNLGEFDNAVEREGKAQWINKGVYREYEDVHFCSYCGVGIYDNSFISDNSDRKSDELQYAITAIDAYHSGLIRYCPYCGKELEPCKGGEIT